MARLNRGVFKEELRLLIGAESVLSRVCEQLAPMIDSPEIRSRLGECEAQARWREGIARRLLTGSTSRAESWSAEPAVLPAQLLRGGYSGRLGQLRGLQELLAHMFFAKAIWAMIEQVGLVMADAAIAAAVRDSLDQVDEQCRWIEATVAKLGVWVMME